MNDRWIYCRLLLDDVARTDELLVRCVRPTMNELLERGAIDRFFFLRYAEGGHHLRLRCRVAEGPGDRVDAASLVRALQTRAPELRVEAGTYEPEVEKHGGPAGMDIAERQFASSSELALACIAETPDDTASRVVLAAWAMHAVFRRVLPSEVDFAASLTAYAAYWAKTCGHDAPAAWANPADESVATVRACLDGPERSLRTLGAWAWPLAARWEAKLAGDLAELDALDAGGQLRAPTRVVAWNIVHTFNNRLGIHPGLEVLVAELVRRAWEPPPRRDALDVARGAIVHGLQQGSVTRLALEGDADVWLAELQRWAEDEGVAWAEARPEVASAEPFGIWYELASTALQKSDLHDRHRAATAPFLDPECPLLPDAMVTHQATFEWLVESVVRAHPSILVVHGVDSLSLDDLGRVDFLARSLTRENVALLLVADGARRHMSDWTAVRDALTRDVELITASTGCAPRGRPAIGHEPSLDRGMALCRAGALHEGSAVLAAALLHGASDEGSEARAHALTCLAMATLQRRRPDKAAPVALRAMAMACAPVTRRRARRVALAAHHLLGRADVLRELGRAADDERRSLDASSRESAWLRQDVAMAESNADDSAHDAALQETLRAPRERVPDHCRAVAHVWLAASDFLAGRLEHAAAHQQAGLALIDAIADDTRALFVRARLAGTLLALGRTKDAVPHLERVAVRAAQIADMALAESAFADAVVGHVALGRLTDAQRVFDESQRPPRGLWRSRAGAATSRYVSAALAYGRDDLANADRDAASLFAELEADASSSRALACLVAFLLCDISRTRKDVEGVQAWKRKADRLLQETGHEDRIRLTAIGARK